MKKMILLTFLLFSCGEEKPIINRSGVYPEYYENFDLEFRQIVMEFETDAAKNFTSYDASNVKSIKMVGDKLSWIDDEANKTAVGICYYRMDGVGEIQIKSSHWEKISYAEKKQMLYHELGHCVMNLDHDDKFYQWPCGNARSIMNSYVLNKEMIDRCWSDMLINYFQYNPMQLKETEDCFKVSADSKICLIK